MIPSKTIVFATLGIWLVFLSTLQIPLIQFIEGDPPSIYNTGDGGMTDLISILTIYKKVKVAEYLGDVWGYDPKSTVFLVAGLSKSLTDLEVESIARWVESGGYLVVLDEYTTPQTLLRRFGLSIGEAFQDIAQGSCRLGTHELKVLFNVYREVIGGEAICLVGDTVVAVSKIVGEGKITVIGDSSLFINEVMRSQYRQSQMSFALDLLDRDTVLFYEGGREFKSLPFSPRFIVLIPYYILRFVSYLLYTGTPYDVVKIFIGASLVLAIISPKLQLRTGMFSKKQRKLDSTSDIKKTFSNSVAVWVEWVSKLGRESEESSSGSGEGN